MRQVSMSDFKARPTSHFRMRFTSNIRVRRSIMALRFAECSRDDLRGGGTEIYIPPPS
jgi:hypothetical protein